MVSPRPREGALSGRASPCRAATPGFGPLAGPRSCAEQVAGPGLRAARPRSRRAAAAGGSEKAPVVPEHPLGPERPPAFRPETGTDTEPENERRRAGAKKVEILPPVAIDGIRVVSH